MRRSAAWVGPLMSLSLAGCDASPAQNIMGSYFPSWLICAVVGVVAALILRQLLTWAGLSRSLLLAPVVYVCLGIGAALTTWLLLFGQ